MWKILFFEKRNSVAFNRVCLQTVGDGCGTWGLPVGVLIGRSISECLLLMGRQRGTNSYYSCFYDPALSDAGKCSVFRCQRLLPWLVLLHPRWSRAKSSAKTKGQWGCVEAAS